MRLQLMNDGFIVQFVSWADRVLLEYGLAPAVAYNFNLYEHEKAFVIQLIGTKSFDTNDDDWACDEAFSSGEDLFELPHQIVGADWRKGLEAARFLVESYLERSKRAEKLKASRAVGVGFVDGDLELVYIRGDA
jgi:hypothetical protein